MKDIKTSWNLELIKNGSNFEKLRVEIEKKAEEFISKWSKDKSYMTNDKTLKTALDEFESFNKELGVYSSEFYYYWLKRDLNQSDADAKANYNKIYDLAIKLENKMQFFSLNLSRIEEKHQQKFLNSNLLKQYHHYLNESFKFSKHTLSDAEEKILNLKSKTSFSNWTNMMSALLSKQEREVLNEKGKKVKKNFSEIIELTSDKNKKVRDYAAKVLNEIFSEQVDVAEHELNSVLENAKINDQIRSYTRPDEARHLGDDIETEVVDTLVSVVTENFQIPKDFYKVKAKFLKLKKLKYHERNIEVGKLNTKYKFEKAYDLVYKTFKNLDNEFANIFESMFKNGQVDVYPSKGKRGGAYAAYNKLNLPNYVLLNHNESLNNVLTIAHEFGHAFHFTLSKIQNELNYSFPMCSAETASTFFEDFVLEEILKTADKDTKQALVMMKLNDEVSTIFRQIAAYNFEFELHTTFREKGYLGKEEIGKIFQKHMFSYMGDAVEKSIGSENWWIYWSHIRNSFYNYSYAFGLLVSKALQRMVKEDPENIKLVKEFLSAGSSKSPKELFLNMGIDITKKEFWKKGIDEVSQLLKEAK